MKKIKFRAWDKDTKSMDYNPTIDGFEVGIVALNSFAYQHSSKIILMQYTGLKDKNGKDVYEDDVVLVNLIGKEILKEYKNYSFRWKANMVLGDDDAHNIANLDSKCLEVIGNIYENPELAK